MTLLKSFSCNRCGIKFTTPNNEKQAQITLQHPYMNESNEVFDLCNDCYTTLLYFNGEYWKRFDKLSERCCKEDLEKEEAKE